MDQNFGEQNSAADDIAAEITKILVKAFTAKEGRAPTGEEVEQLIEELTEERIESMLGGLGDDDEESDGRSDDSEQEDAGDAEEAKEDAEKESEVEEPVSTSTSGTKRSLDDDVRKDSAIEGDSPIDTKKSKADADA